MDGGLNYYDDIPHKRPRDDLPLTPTMFGAAAPSAGSAGGLEPWNSRAWGYPWGRGEGSGGGAGAREPYSSLAASHASATPPLSAMDAGSPVLPYNSQYSQSPYSGLGPQYTSQGSSAMDSRISPQLPSYSYTPGQGRTTFTPTSQNSATTSSQYEDSKLNVWSSPTYSLSNHTAQPVISDTKRLFDTAAANPYMGSMGLNTHQASPLASMSPYGQHSLSDFTATSMSHLEAQARGVVGLQNFVNDAGFLNHAPHHPGYPSPHHMAMGADPYNPYAPSQYPGMYAPGPPPIPYDPYADVKDVAGTLLAIETQFCSQLQMLRFNEPVMCIYNPLEYAWEPHRNYAEKYCSTRKTVLFLGMNPGPYGMAQTGVPFGEVKLVKEWLGITGLVGKPYNEHPKRPVLGFECTRSEVSGARFWGFLKKYCEKPEVLFKHSYVHNICPLVFMNKTGRNLTPPDLRAAERKPLIEVCHRYLVEVVRLLGVSIIVGVGKFAQREAKAALDEAGIRGIKVESIMHPSPANPAANRGWEDVVHKELEELDVLRFLGPGPKPKPPEEPAAPPPAAPAPGPAAGPNPNPGEKEPGTGSESHNTPQSQGTPGTPSSTPAGGDPGPTKVEASVSPGEGSNSSSQQGSSGGGGPQPGSTPPLTQEPPPPAANPGPGVPPSLPPQQQQPQELSQSNGGLAGQSQAQQHPGQQGGVPSAGVQQPPSQHPQSGMGTPPTPMAQSSQPPMNAVGGGVPAPQVSQHQSLGGGPIPSPVSHVGGVGQGQPTHLPATSQQQPGTDTYHRDLSQVPTVPSPGQPPQPSLHSNGMQQHSNGLATQHHGGYGGSDRTQPQHHNPHQTSSVPPPGGGGGGSNPQHPQPPTHHLHHPNTQPPTNPLQHNPAQGMYSTHSHPSYHHSNAQYHPGNGVMGGYPHPMGDSTPHAHMGETTPQYNTGHLGQQLYSSQAYNGPQ